MSSHTSNGTIFITLVDRATQGVALSVRTITPAPPGSSAAMPWEEDSCQIQLDIPGLSVTPALLEHIRPLVPSLCAEKGFHGDIKYCSSETEMDQRIQAIKTSSGSTQSTKFTATQLRFKDAVFEILNQMDNSNRAQSLELAALTKAMAEQLFSEKLRSNNQSQE